jgi:predicted nucleotidyltransferase
MVSTFDSIHLKYVVSYTDTYVSKHEEERKIMRHTKPTKSQDSSVGIATDYGLDGLG